MNSTPGVASSSSAVEEIVRREVPNWDDEVAATARFKAFSGQRSDWEPKFLFWRDLIIRVARHLGVCTIRLSEVKTIWFSRGGLFPLCLDRVMQEMYNNDDILLRRDLTDPSSGRVYRMLRRAGQLVGAFRSLTLIDNAEESLILKPLLQEYASDVISNLAENHWTSTCIVTMDQFRSICKGSGEAFTILSYLCECGKAQYLSIRKEDIIEGVKVSLVPASLPNISSLDYDVLHLVWTTEKLHKQLNAIDCRWDLSRKMALASFKLGNKQAAYRHVRQAKMLSETRSKYTSFLERVEEVLSIVANAESTKKVSEALQIGVRAMKEYKVSIEGVEADLQELDDCVKEQKEVDEVIESMPLQTLDMDDEDVEEEFKKLEFELSGEIHPPQLHEPVAEDAKEEAMPQPSAETLIQSFSKVRLEAA
ncbi:charged multivesicular body protein 7 [Canna indica]|uniref:Charged multivesicular body protein 7 n=1 Tax=Canna indica TaxID=4628 RepID=A0AAQ3KM21_9LILI|nr:charged multivesicular body protein 7 [Canna indica]